METDEVVIPKLTVKTLSDKSISIDASSEIQTIADIKKALEKHGTLTVSKQILISSGHVLLDNEPAPSPSTVLYLFYYEPSALLADPIETAKDWDTKNRLKVFKGLYLSSRRQFLEAAPFLVDSLTTFGENSFIPFKDLVKYTVIASMLVLDRPSILQKIIKSPEVLEVIDEMAYLKDYVDSFYNCRYKEFFASLAKVEGELKKDWLLQVHTQYIIKEMRIRAYTQMLQSYKSLSLPFMSQSFGVSEDFIDRELNRFIAAGRLNCYIDKVAGVVMSRHTDKRNSEYLLLLKQGDNLTSRMQKLGRILTF